MRLVPIVPDPLQALLIAAKLNSIKVLIAGFNHERKTFEDFAIAARAAGFEEVLERRWAPDTELDVHTHNFDAEAVVNTGRDVADLRWCYAASD